VAGAAIINGVQTIVSRNTDPFEPLVCGVCSVHAGDADFFITDKMRMTGAIRCLNEETLERSVQRLQDLINATAQAYNCSARIELIREVPPLVNDPALTALARSAAEQILGKENIEKVPPMLGSDDLAVFGKYMPVFYYFLGTGFKDRKNASLHSPEFCLNYEALPFGPALLAQSAALALERESTTSP
jgi:metal-dependent amidase/aminoacylase/carboxypeptidase family protein